MNALVRKALSTTLRPFEWVRKEADLIASRNICVDDLRTVCLALGPYRNLTTLTAAILALHPHCQVLNHAAGRIMDDRRLDFLRDYSDGRFTAFARYVIHISQSGRRGDYGGSIVFSHAFDKQYATDSIFTKSFGNTRRKEKIHALFWKESLRTSNHISTHRIDLGTIFDRNTALRFLAPVRNPLDCAFSNVRTGHARFFRNLSSIPSVEEVLEVILDEFLWVETLRLRYPDRFFVFFEHELSREMLVRLAEFLKLDPDATWCQNALTILEVKGGRRHHEALIAFFRRRVETKFRDHPEFAEKLLHFVGNP